MNSYSQTIDTLQVTEPTDTLLTRPQKSDSLIQQKADKQKPAAVNLRHIYLDIQGSIVTNPDSMNYIVYRFSDLLLQNYHGFGDVFHTQPTVQVYDFLDMGEPRFAASLNLLPHQSALQMGGRTLNDPLHGMYNLRFLSLDNIESIEISQTADVHAVNGTPMLSNYVNINQRILLPEEPYTRIMYRGGDFGFVDLDISFAKKFSERFAVQLGGMNKYYDPNHYRGTQYRGAIYYQPTGQIMSKTSFLLNREDVVVENYNDASAYRYDEARDDITSDLFYYDDKDQTSYWHLQGAVSRTRRKNVSNIDTFRIRSRYDQFRLGADRIWQWKKHEVYTNLSVYQNIVWGTPFYQKYTDSGLRGDLALRYRLFDNLVFIPALKIDFRWDAGYDYAPHLSLNWQPGKFNLRVAVNKNYRLPNRNELAFHFRDIDGNRNLDAEKMEALAFELTYRPVDFFYINLKSGYQRIGYEIIFNGKNYYNGGDRDFSCLGGDTRLSFYKFALLGGGQLTQADVNITPETSAWLQLRYHDVWLKGAVTIDALGGLYWKGAHANIAYSPIAERFYRIPGQNDGYLIYRYKIAATVSDAQLYFSMDNPFSTQYSVIDGYYEFYRRVRFGVNWVMWD